MKYCLSLLIVLFALVSCQKELTEDIFNQPIDTTITINPIDSGSFQVKINGVLKVADDFVEVELTTDSTNKVKLELNAFYKDGRSILLTVEDFKKGTYQLSAPKTMVEYDDSLGVNYASGNAPAGTSPGSITITDIDSVNKVFSGTFQAIAYQSSTSDSLKVTFTEGSFVNIPYSTTPIIVPPAGNDTLHVKINDTLFNAFSIAPNALAGKIIINGSDSAGTKTVTISLPETITAGSYNFDLINRSAIYSTSGTNAFIPALNSGSLQILEYNATTRRLRGNFSFTGSTVTTPAQTARLTEGYFSVQVQ